MLISILLTLVVTVSGAVVSYLYDDDAPLAVRLCAGAATGLAALGIVGFAVASLIGLNPLSIVLSTIVAALPLLLLLNEGRRLRFQSDLELNLKSFRQAINRPRLNSVAGVTFFGILAVLLWSVFDRAMFENAGNIYTGVTNNFGDLPFHLSVITSFSSGQNFPPEDPTYSGVRFTYPFVSDFVASIFVRTGASLRDAMFVENLALGLSLIGLLYYFGFKLTRDRLAARLSVLLVLFSGGLGWLKLYGDLAESGKGIFQLLMNLPQREYTIIPALTIRWANSISALFVPQRGLLMGLPIALIVFTVWWREWAGANAAEEVNGETEGGSKSSKSGRRFARASVKRRPGPHLEGGEAEISGSFKGLWGYAGARRMFFAGTVAGLLPLVHAHTFVVVMMVGACLALLSGRRKLLVWIPFFVAASLIGGPQMLWATHGSSVQSSTFVGWEFGWDHGQDNIVWFWLKNAGLFIPLTIVALCWRSEKPLVSRQLALFYLPFTLCFIIPNIMKLAPWIWDNIKVLIYWWVASAPIVALLLARIWRRGLAGLAVAVCLLITLTLAGALDVWRIASRQVEIQEFSRDQVQFARFLEANTPPNALVLHATVHNHPSFLTGRRSVMGYPGHIWTHGLPFVDREADIRRMYLGTSDSSALLARYGVDYVIVSPIEQGEMPVSSTYMDQNLIKVGEVGEYRLYKVQKR